MEVRITDMRLGTLSVPLKKPFRTALREVHSVEDIVVRLETDTGHVGYGEAPPTAVITGDIRGSIVAALEEHLKPLLLGRDVEDLDDLLRLLDKSLVHNSSPKAALDMALHDLWGQRYGAPLARLLGSGRRELETDLTISVDAPEVMVADSLEAVRRGFRILKLKVGKNPALDLVRITAIRDAVGPSVAFRLDANQGWSPKEAVRILRKLEETDPNLELVEQPVPAEDIEGMKLVRNAVSVPVLADESVYSPGDAARILAEGAADLVNIKLMKSGGIRRALQIAAVAESFGVEAMIGSMMETKLSVTAAAHVAAACSCITRIDLDTPDLCAEDPVEGGITCDGPRIVLGEGPGLGFREIRNVVWH
jgi:L-alanine-DL-glutamate epimerase-like enolase superfamily enzyme